MKPYLCLALLPALALLLHPAASASPNCYPHYLRLSRQRDQIRGAILLIPATLGSIALLKHDTPLFKDRLLNLYGLTAVAAVALPPNRYQKVIDAYEEATRRKRPDDQLERLTRKVNRILGRLEDGVQAVQVEVANHLRYAMETGLLCTREEKPAVVDYSETAKILAELIQSAEMDR
jgi:hypothetical protein